MSTTKRLVSGNLSSWARIGITFLSRLLLVPVYLSYWSAELYGIWISIEAFVSVITTISKGHQNYLGFEFLKLGQNNRKQIATYLWSGCAASLVLGLLELLIIGGIIWSGALDLVVDESTVGLGSDLVRDISIILVLEGVSWLIVGSIGGVVGRVLHAFGYYPRMSWWGVFSSAITAIFPVIAVVFGADLLTAGMVLAGTKILYNIPLFYDMYLLLRKERLWYYGHVTIKIGFKNLYHSLVLSGKDLLESLRQQGVRIVLAPLSGAMGVAAFSTMRTGANVVIQGLGTITNPMMPELMRFLNQKDQERTEVAFGTVWFVIMLFSPAVVLLQAFIEPLYVLWTRDSLTFDPLLFAVLSLGVLVYGLAQPAIAVARGNNLLKPQLFISILAAIAVVGGMFVLVPLLGILGAGLALLASELIALVCYRYVTIQWLYSRGMEWPSRPFNKTAISVVIAAVAMGCIVWFPAFNWLTLMISLPLLLWAIKRYWDALPDLATEHALRLLKQLPIIKNLV